MSKFFLAVPLTLLAGLLLGIPAVADECETGKVLKEVWFYSPNPNASDPDKLYGPYEVTKGITQILGDGARISICGTSVEFSFHGSHGHEVKGTLLPNTGRWVKRIFNLVKWDGEVAPKWRGAVRMVNAIIEHKKRQSAIPTQSLKRDK
ncbi:MAG: hypothetical protein QF858_00900 [Candidatus Pacebacteria bacterium]|jgi:hypothetical protein|nr:hypothetical protein [bacterium]MDP6527424.1 hypothetical protein [Candidatus Paceibacterota bacterium]MDP6659669.1 hypothetical protein [Candidatus Paceibacterota bacterium]|tara:strand:- start:9755 stop:10201 length:447 start_codon:yes stop_codon:yes gene_type:complete